MLNPNLLIFYVKNPIDSASFYEKLFEKKPLSVFPTYAAFSFPNGFYFGLWSTTAKNFHSCGTGSRSELSFMVADREEIHRLREAWGKLEVVIEQDLAEAVFGLTFVALDPDGHRIRVCLPDR